jgi:hypothetical protein
MRETAPDFTPYYAQMRGMPEIAAGTVLEGERMFAPLAA